MKSLFHIVFFGCAVSKLSRLMCHVRDCCGYRISYIVTLARDADVLLASGVPKDAVYKIDLHNLPARPASEDIENLWSLERDDVPTIHNMIMSDRVIRRLPYSEALAYAAHLARALKQAYQELQPSVILGGHDGVLSSLAFAVAKAEGLPWFALNFSVIPVGYVALSSGIIPDRMVRLREHPDSELDGTVEKLLSEFEQKRLRAPAYVSAHSIPTAIRRLKVHVPEALRSLQSQMRGRFERYGELPFRFKRRQYLRKRMNILRFPNKWFVTAPPAEPFVFFGLHMQPESSIDVYAPFYANQFDVVEKVARALPPTHTFLVKLHISDADNYSRNQLRFLRQLPGVKLVLPTVSSRPFIDRCAAVVTISGTMGLEGALLGKPVIAFGRMNYGHFPSVKQVRNIYDLPGLIRNQLSAPQPSRQEILQAYKEYLGAYICATGPQTHAQLDDWTQPDPSPDELRGFEDLFRVLEEYLTREARSG